MESTVSVSKATMKPLTREETKCLIGLIEQSNIITNKTTNAKTNKMKNDEWIRITNDFNATVATCLRTPQQLRLKWENLKKNARRRSSAIQTDGAGPDDLPHNDILDRVAALLGSTVDSYTVQFGGDSKVENLPIFVAVGTCNNDADQKGVMEDDSGSSNYDSDKEHLGGISPLVNKVEGSNAIPKHKWVHSLVKPQINGSKRKLNNEDDINKRNKAIIEYYIMKQKNIEANIKNTCLSNRRMELENRKLELEIQKLELENEKLQLEIVKLKG